MLPLIYDRRPEDHKTPEESEALARAMLVKVGLADRMDHPASGIYPAASSQRVAVARALINNPVMIHR